jgi:membrane-bound lytic murein transglycosylase D
MEERIPMTLLFSGRLAPALLALLLAACATNVPVEPPPEAPAPVVVAASAPEPAAPAASAATAEAEEPPADAAGAPTDPLASTDAIVDLADAAARRDLWVRIRRGFAIPDLDTELVRDRERWYASRPDYVERMTTRSSRYLYHIVEEVEKRGLPTELALLPFIESAFNPQAMSSAKASGMWQFIPSTGRHFELRQNIFRDDRRDVLASTGAALDYLERLHGMFGDWHLALAAYNWGEGSVSRAIARNRKLGLPTDYLSLKMPAETRLYVPKLQAVENLIAQPEVHALTLPPLENHPYFLAVPIKRDIDAALVAELAGLPEKEFQALNPSLNKPVILAAGTPQVLLPYDNAHRFILALPEHKGPLASWTAWVVPKTMKPADAAKRCACGMNESALRELNRIPPRMLVKGGSTLLVPRNGHGHSDVSERIADHATIVLAPDRPPLRRTAVKARKGDTLNALARRHRVSLANLAEWNGLSTTTKLRAGQQLVVYRAPTRSSKAVATKRPASKSTASSAKRRVATTTR